MKLTEAELHKRFNVVDIQSCPYQQRLLELGIMKGCEVCPLNNLNGTVLVDIKGCRYAFGEEIAKHINVEEKS